jgi:SAM-dependent methyltransferase
VVAQPEARAVWDNIFSHPNKARKSSGFYFYRLALDRIKWGETICDVGCGYTFALHDLMRRCGPEGSFIGVDFSSVALAKSAKLADKYRNAHLLLADMRQLPLPDGCVDGALCAEGLPYLLMEAEKGLQELARVSRDEVIFSVHTRGAYEIKATSIEFRGNIVLENKPGSKPPRRVFEREEILEMVATVGNLCVEVMQPLRWADVCTMPFPAPWPSYLPSMETIALYYVVARKAQYKRSA